MNADLGKVSKSVGTQRDVAKVSLMSNYLLSKCLYTHRQDNTAAQTDTAMQDTQFYQVKCEPTFQETAPAKTVDNKQHNLSITESLVVFTGSVSQRTL